MELTTISLIFTLVAGVAIVATLWNIRAKKKKNVVQEGVRVDVTAVDKIEAEMKEVEQRLATAIEENKQLSADHATEIDELRKQIEQEKKNCQELLKKAQNECDSLNEKLTEKYQQQLKKVQSECDSLNEQLKWALDGKLDAITKEKFAIVDELKAQLKTLEDELEGCTNNLADCERSIKQKDANINELQQALGKEQTQVKTLLSELNNSKQMLDSKMVELKGLNTALIAEQANVKQLTQAKKKLEDELEDYADDLSDCERKIKQKDANIKELEQSLSKEQAQVRTLLSELNNTKQVLSEKMAELNLKMNSLAFIQEVLSAKELQTADIQKLHKSIAEFETFVEGDFLSAEKLLFDNGVIWNDDTPTGDASYNACKATILPMLGEWAARKRKNWLDGKKTIAFVGEFSAGKTSIVNRILSQDDPKVPRLPVSTKATTAIPTYIAGGTAVSYSFIAGDERRKIISESTFNQVSKDILGQIKGVSSLIKYFVMTYNNPHLKGLSILDTPGFSSNDVEDRERTLEVINECDALFWVFDVNGGTVNRSSLAVLREGVRKPLFVVINKVDTKSVTEVNKVEALIRKTFDNEGIVVQQYIRFSSKSSLADIMNPIKVSVSTTNNNSDFVRYVGGLLDWAVNWVSDSLARENTELEKSKEEARQLESNFYGLLRGLQSHCEVVGSIPQYNERLFREDNYTMSQQDYGKLTRYLDEISETPHRITEIFDARVELQSDMVEVYKDISKFIGIKYHVENSIELYKKIVNRHKF